MWEILGLCTRSATLHSWKDLNFSNSWKIARSSILTRVRTYYSKIWFLVGNKIYLVVNNIFHRYNGIMGENLVMSFYYGPDSDFGKFQNFFCQKMSGWRQKFLGALVWNMNFAILLYMEVGGSTRRNQKVLQVDIGLETETSHYLSVLLIPSKYSPFTRTQIFNHFIQLWNALK